MTVSTIDLAQATPRTLLTVTHFFPAHGGGLELVAEQLARRFAERGTAVEWFSSDTDPPPAPAVNRAAVPVATANIIERLTQLPYPLWSLTVVPALWRAIGRADVVHIHEHLYFGSIVSVTIARLRRRPTVITQHTGAVNLDSKVWTTLYQLATRLLGRPIFAAATRAVFVSANVRAFFRMETSAKTRLIFNGIDTDRFTPCTTAERSAARARLGYPKDRPIALYVGRFVRKKGLHTMRELTRRLPELLWVFVGSGPEDPARWGLDNVSVAGRVEHENLPDFYQAADFLVLPSWSEGFPLVVQEALACGLGVLSTREVGSACPQARHLIRVPPGPDEAADIREWEQGVRALLADALYLEAREARARDAHELWSWDRCACEYLRLFDEIATDGRRA
jgi:glycosyltransferase involved in cell wall biosynthesis